MNKVCKLCEEEKSITDFYNFNDKWANKSYTSARCKPCHALYKKSNINKSRNSKAEKLKLRYGLTYDAWEELRESENFACMICGITEEEIGRVLDVDHCHTSNKVRGVLCNHCNAMLGHARDNVEVLKAGIEYLTKYGDGYK